MGYVGILLITMNRMIETNARVSAGMLQLICFVWTFAFAVWIRWHDADCDEQKDEEECMSFRWGGIVQLVVQTGSVLWPHTRQ